MSEAAAAGKRIFITGGASGLGRALAERYARAGWRVCIGDLDVERCADALAAIRVHSPHSQALACDVTREDALQAAADWLQREWGGVDVVVNNAGVAQMGGIAETTLNSGSICVRTSRSQQSVRLRPDERLVFNETSGSMIIEQVNASNYNSWIQPTLTFFDMTLEDIITHLERWFNVPIGTDASVDRTIRLSFHVRHESLEETLQVISLITGLQYTLDGESASFHTARTTRSR